MKRTGIKRHVGLKRSRPVRLEASRPLAVWCDLKLEGCDGRACHRHERKARGHGGTGEPANTLDLCNACHRYVHLHPAESKGNGWIVNGVARGGDADDSQAERHRPMG